MAICAGRGVVTGDDRGGIAGRQMQQQEHEHADQRHHEQRGEQPAGDIGAHQCRDQVFFTFQNGMMSGMPMKPLDVLAQAAG